MAAMEIPIPLPHITSIRSACPDSNACTAGSTRAQADSTGGLAAVRYWNFRMTTSAGSCKNGLNTAEVRRQGDG